MERSGGKAGESVTGAGESVPKLGVSSERKYRLTDALENC
jgi:hypothetical protein